MKRSTKAIIAFISLISMFVCMFNGQMFLGVILCIAGSVFLLLAFVPTDEEIINEQNQRANELKQLAKEYGININNFQCSIGNFNVPRWQYDPISIDTVHDLVAGICTIDTVQRTIVFPVSHIISCSLEYLTDTTNNAKSRAIIGGVLAGTVGAIAGASSATTQEHIVGYKLVIQTDLPKIGTVSFRVEQNLGISAIQYLKSNPNCGINK